ncbi:MAG: response regulator transcription factor [Armatimonadota bacterium]|nr:response regulator transcription factor [Armatimonadota bacterium]MDR5704248.1 response regulator transcription factor [Armatimonadota bacterium]MDR7433534.1 response regulator transcription factor [Armatimonadota bacterium]
MATVHVYVAASETLIREGLRCLFSRDPTIEVIDGSPLDSLCEAEQVPDVAILVVGVPTGDSVEVIRNLCRRFPKIKVLALVASSAQEAMLSALRAGAAGCLPLDADPGDLIAAVRTLAQGECYLHPLAAAAIMNEYRQGEAASCAHLSPREEEILSLLASGATNREIAKRLHLSTRTVEAHRAKIMAKLGAQHLVDLIRHAIRRGLIKL